MDNLLEIILLIVSILHDNPIKIYCVRQNNDMIVLFYSIKENFCLFDISYLIFYFKLDYSNNNYKQRHLHFNVRY
jgi:hypothetical protein